MLEALFKRARDAGRAAFVPYVMAGDPDAATTLAVLAALTQSGADAIELGIPYGDPLADGPTVAAAGQRALAAGTTIDSVLELVREHHDRGGAPAILFTYFNPVYHYGISRFAQRTADAGACGAIVPDIALEEGGELRASLAENGLDMPLLVAPSTKPERAKRIAEQSTGFMYVVSRLGVTGAGTQPAIDALRSQIEMLRTFTDTPLAVGFGVSSAEHVRAVARLADGFIVGSALIDAYAGTRGEEAADHVRAFVEPLIAAAKGLCA
ncbi:MAG TPA: tryptophan synthase subunit alpha [Candidatus Baltobacteraceae bacterium]|nr:tryptophan synthase subunit alpha [Candidatus Baltobacteraceae bacterium]